MPASRRARIIYWAEDDDADRYMIRDTAQKIRPEAVITFFEDGQSLLDSLVKDRPEQVVLDIRMPRMSGVQALEALRREPRNADLPVIMFTTALVPGELEACHRLGVQAFVQKPNEFAAFQQAVRDIIEGTATGVQPAKGRALVA